jgi:hypothetical protein
MDHIGIDVHKRESQIYILAQGGEVVEQRIRTEPERFAAVLGARPRARILTRLRPIANGSPAVSRPSATRSSSPTRPSPPCMPPAPARSRPTGAMTAPWPRRACSAPTAPPIASPIPSATCGAGCWSGMPLSGRARAISRSYGPCSASTAIAWLDEHGQRIPTRPCPASQVGANRLGEATARAGGREAAKASGRLTPHGGSRCCRTRSFRLPASRRHCTCSRTCCRSEGQAGASSARASPAGSGDRRDSTPPTRQSCPPCPHSRPGRRRSAWSASSSHMDAHRVRHRPSPEDHAGLLLHRGQ